MEYSVKKEARKQYFGYFKVWFIVLGILLLVFIGTSVIKNLGKAVANKADSVSDQAVEERVFDYADVLTDSEEQQLREYIAQKESEYKVHFVLLTAAEDVESYAQGNWELGMRTRADEFYTDNKFGYNRVGGDGIILFDNWYDGEKGRQVGSWVVTSGKIYQTFNTNEVNEVLDAVYWYVEQNPYKAYKAYVDKTCEILDDPVNGGEGIGVRIPGLVVFILPIVTALIFAFTHLKQKSGDVTTSSVTYVAGGKPIMKAQSDNFIRKNVVTRHIQTSSSGGGSSSRSGGGGGSFRSSGGGSRGGGGRRR